jgi:hypothetical protein
LELNSSNRQLIHKKYVLHVKTYERTEKLISIMNKQMDFLPGQEMIGNYCGS